MIRNYVKIAIRSIRKNRVYASVNILGLAIGIAAAIFILQYVSYEHSFEKFHQNHQNLYRVQYKTFKDGQAVVNSATAVPRVGPFMKENLPEVLDYARAYPVFGVMESDDKEFRENRVYIADPSLLTVFDFPLMHGDARTALSEPNQIVITASTAKKYFNRTDVVGEKLTFHPWFDSHAKISGVTEDIPDNTHFKFDFLISFESLNQQSVGEDGSIASEDSWDWSSFYTYVLLKDGTGIKEVDKKFDLLLQKERGKAFEANGQVEKYPLQAITDIHLYSQLEREADPEGQGDGQVVFFLSLIAGLTLLIAWINYINLSTARSIERAKEVGLRKTMGAHRRQLVTQFLTEAAVFNLIALGLAITAVVFAIEFFNELTGSQLSVNFLTDSNFWVAALLILSTGAALSGIYPSLVLSSFKPYSVLKGRLGASKTGVFLRKGLVVTQFAVSIALIAGTIVVFQQLTHLKNVSLGFDLANSIVVKGPMLFDEDRYPSTLQAFKDELTKNSQIKNVTASSNVPGDEIIWTNGIKRFEESDQKMKNISFVGVDYDYFSTYDIKVLAGRSFDKSFSSDTGTVILNLAATQLLGFEHYEDALQQKVALYGDPKTVIGVVDNYKQMSPKSAVGPIVFPLSPDMTYYFTAKVAPGKYQESLELLQASYEQFFPGNPFNYFVLDDFFNKLYQKDEKFSKVFSLFAALAIVIACLGLFGLSSFNALQRTKEIGIRKTLGASINHILLLLTKEFLILIIVANVIAWPIIYLLMNGWLDNFATRVSLGAPVFLLSGALVIVVAILTVGIKTLKTAKANPVEALRHE